LFSLGIVTLKLTGQIPEVSWWWALSPVWGTLAFVGVLTFICIVIALALFGRLRH
jgi:fructose-1,6-bisphosphatase/inositol monophosphatase family enzyme